MNNRMKKIIVYTKFGDITYYSNASDADKISIWEQTLNGPDTTINCGRYVVRTKDINYVEFR